MKVQHIVTKLVATTCLMMTWTMTHGCLIQTLVKANRDSRFYRYESYVMEKNQETEQFDFFDDIRFEDSLFTNTEL